MTSVSPKNQLAHKSNNHLHATLRMWRKYAGVSIKTVSRVVNHQNEISEETRQRVQAAIDELGYRAERAGAQLNPPAFENAGGDRLGN